MMVWVELQLCTQQNILVKRLKKFGKSHVSNRSIQKSLGASSETGMVRVYLGYDKQQNNGYIT